MRKRKNIKKSEDDDSSGVADEPEEFQDSGEDWTPDATAEPAPVVATGRGGRKKAAAKGAAAKGAVAPPVVAKKKKKNETTDESEAEEEAEDEEDSDDEKNGSDKSDSSQQKDVPKHFHSGNFVLLKTDVTWDGDTVKSKASEINLWKIDGKALLQKYIPLENNGKTLHKCTCVYSGWNVDNRENYYPVTEILDKNPKTTEKQPCVAIDLAELIKVKDKI